MHLGVQYYRPPFPAERYWKDDMKRIRDSGLNTVQLWVLWGWVEARPGRLIYDDYDRLLEEADRNGLGVVFSTIAEIQPHWIHREVPGSEMIDHRGVRVVSSNRCECHFGITPGGCTDHPGVWERMANFLARTVERYRAAPNLVGWDAWNELRWNVHADGLVCFCPHTLQAFRAWLEQHYGSLAGLNRAWQRRYGDWSEVMPGKLPDRTYTEMMSWEHFITERANQHGVARYRLMKRLDPRHPITVHAATPCPLTSGGRENYPLERGNDWAYADVLDGIGCSSFPAWSGMDDADFGLRVECVKSAARDKKVWLSEVQGGRAATGFAVHVPVQAWSQQRWIWNGIACGADTILFWCWRDEVFGRESGGFGLIGLDGQAEERLAAMRITGRILRRYGAFLDCYQPTRPDVGLWFSPHAYYLGWAQEATADRFVQSLVGYARALVRRCIPYRLVEEEHLEDLRGLKVLFLPRALVTDSDQERALAHFVRQGGTLVCESECGAFRRTGLYRYPEDRFVARLTGVQEVGRRALEDSTIAFLDPDGLYVVPATQWLTPLSLRRGAAVWAKHKDGALAQEIRVGKGRVVWIGGYLGDAYRKTPTADFEAWLTALCRRAGWIPHVDVLSPAPTPNSFLYVKHGTAKGRRVVFVFFPPDIPNARLRFASGFVRRSRLRDLISGRTFRVERMRGGRACTVQPSELGLCVLVEEW